MDQTRYDYDISFCEDSSGRMLLLKLPRGTARAGMIASIADGRSFPLTNVCPMDSDLYGCYISLCNDGRCYPVTALQEIVWSCADGR